MSVSKLHHIVIIGGGAGGLELATRLGNKIGKRKREKLLCWTSIARIYSVY